MQKITNNVYVETECRICNNSFVVTSEGIVMVDTPMQPDDAIGWRDQIAKYGELKYLINSEPHMDHFATNYYFGGTVISHEGSRAAILAASVEEYKKNMKETAPQCLPLMDTFSFRPPSITFSKELTFYLGNHTFRLINLPGHSPYQLAVYVPEERVIFTSDNVVYKQQPFFHQAVPYEWLDSLKKLEQLDADILVPGHGGICDKKQLKVMSENIQNFIDAVTEAIKKGLTLEQAQDKVSVLDRYTIAPGMEQRAREIQKMGIARLYSILKK